jgi:hypothetical protein
MRERWPREARRLFLVSCQIADAVALILLIRRLATPWRQQIGPGFGSTTRPCLCGLHLPSENSTAN